MKASSQPEARGIIHLLGDFSVLWQQMTLAEQKAILQAVFAS
jgi:hypothetical protein